jgi:serine/threonine protein kinase
LGIEECHTQGVIHRDLKLENVLFESKGRSRIKIIDFGISGVCKGLVKEDTDAGTLRYMSPEVLSGLDNKANPAIDIWGMGVMLYCMVFYKYPFNGSSHSIIKERIASGEVLFPTNTPVSVELKDLIRKLLTKEVASRISL